MLTETEVVIAPTASDAPASEPSAVQAAPAAACTIDPLDTAYLAIGAMTAWTTAGTALKANYFGGQIEFVSNVIEHAQRLADHWAQHEDTFSGVWAYEVAETFGAEVGAHLLDGDTFDPDAVLSTIIAAASH